ncbi:S41 family peptidase [Pedobacter sp. KR3-3]|uniref:S41 family peptidase n=1 Tax=Pedobacter albus TaxID=3113905 RepID=A0ABU7I8G0_9SPHI|nr:S41 family peptidase [Pedobacter sp. KR3-3]MEE1945745.1 S41 family peptidase [Pedobacter sp. KR3-3]
MKQLFTSLLVFLCCTSVFANGIDTAKAEKRFSKKELLDDMDYLVATTNEVHPNMYHSISKAKYRKLRDSLANLLHDGMSPLQAWPVMAPLVGSLNEGHSSLNLPDELLVRLKANENILFPVVFSGFDGQELVVRADVSTENKLVVGDKLVSINGITAGKLVDLLSRHMGGLKSWRAVDVCRDMPAYLDIYGIKGPYRLVYLHEGKTMEATLNPISLLSLRERLGRLPKAPKKTDYAFDRLADGNGYLKINSLTAKPEVFKSFLDSAFRQLKQQSPKRLIIDLRLNGGGNSALGEMLLGYITEKPFRMTGGVRWKVSQTYKAQLDERMKGEGAKEMPYYFEAKNGTVLKSSATKPQPPSHNDLLYKGEVFVLIGPKTFSSANMLANTIQDYHLATLVGEATGEPANDYGELIYLKLPHTGFTFSTSTKQFVRANGQADDPRPVLPNYTVKDNPVTQADEVLEFVSKLK